MPLFSAILSMEKGVSRLPAHAKKSIVSAVNESAFQQPAQATSAIHTKAAVPKFSYQSMDLYNWPK